MTARPLPLEDRLAAIAKGGSRSWASIASVLDDVDQSEHWRASASSFSQFVRTFAYSMGLGEGSLWRYLTAYRYLEQLRSTLVARGINVQTLEELSKTISPESLELFSKIARAAPDDVLDRLARRLVSGEVTRGELRAAWVAFRPLVEGVSARGRGSVAPRITNPTRAQVCRQLRASVLHALVRSDSRWLECDAPSAFAVLPEVRVLEEAGTRSIPVLDAVVILQRSGEQFTELHGVQIVVVVPEAMPLVTDRISQEIKRLQPYADRFWIAQHHRQTFVGPSHLPKYIGMIVMTEEGIVVQRIAEQPPTRAVHAEALLRSVLPHVLRR